MGNTFARLFPFSRRGSRGDASRIEDAAGPGDAATEDDDPLVNEDEPLAADRGELDAGPVLLPAAIYRQLLYDPAEVPPVWARPRPAPTQQAAAAAPGPAATRDPATPPPPAVGEPAGPVSATADPVKPAKRTRRPKVDASAVADANPAPTRPKATRAVKKAQDLADR